MNNVLKFVKLSPNAKLPFLAHDTDSGMDICSIEDGYIQPHSFMRFHTGIAAIIPHGGDDFVYELQVRPRSGLAHKHGIVAAFGTIDEGYRGDIGIALYNHGQDTFKVTAGERIAQLVLAKVPRLKVEEGTLAELSAETTERGVGGFGSTGV